MQMENENIKKKLIHPPTKIEKPVEKKMTEEETIEFQQFIEFKKEKILFKNN